MKKALFAFFMLMVCATFSVHAIPKNYVKLKYGKVYTYLSVSFVERDKTNYMVVTSGDHRYSFSEEVVMTIRFFDNTVMEVEGKRLTENTRTIGGLFSKSDYIETTVEFPFTDALHEKMKGGIQKIRFSTVPQNVGKEYKKDKLGKQLLKIFEKAKF